MLISLYLIVFTVINVLVALDAMKKAHEHELNKERNKFLDALAKTFSQADVESLQRQHEYVNNKFSKKLQIFYSLFIYDKLCDVCNLLFFPWKTQLNLKIKVLFVIKKVLLFQGKYGHH